MRKSSFILAASIAVIASSLWAPGSARAAENLCQGGDRVAPVTVFGRAHTTFSREPAVTEADLQRLFERFEADLRTVLEKAKWGGNPDDLFAAVRSGAAIERSVPAGTEFEWMAFRKKGQAACVNNILWKGSNDFPAWNIEVESNGYRYTFVVPKTCLNLSIQSGTTRMIPPPTCELSASFDAATDTITVRGATDGTLIRVTSVAEPGGEGDESALAATGTDAWSYRPNAGDGLYTFSANAIRAGSPRGASCSASVNVVRQKPECNCSHSVNPDTGLVSIDCSASVGDVAITKVTNPDGSPGDTSRLMKTGDKTWTYDPGDALPKKPGDYQFSFDCLSSLHGMEHADDFAATVTKKRWGGPGSGAAATLGGAGDWIVRGLAVGSYGNSDPIMTATAVPDVTQVRTKRSLGDGSGFGLGLEYLLAAKLGLELEGLFLDHDAQTIIDIGPEWTMFSSDVSVTPLSLGLNYHLTPNSLADVYIGPFVSYVDFDDGSFSDGLQSFGSETTAGAKLGADFYLGWDSRWAVSSAIRYMPLTAGDGDNEFDLDPLIGTVGVGVRF